MNRRDFLAAAGTFAAAAAVPAAQGAPAPGPQAFAPGKGRFRAGLVAYSYRTLLDAKKATYDDLVRLCVETGADGIDLTSYWLPTDGVNQYLASLRRLAWRNRVEIYSVGTRVQLIQTMEEGREKQVADVRKWVDVAQRLGATHIRVFANQKPETMTVAQAIEAAGDTFRRLADVSGERGVFLGLEDDGGITVHAQECIAIVKRANHPFAQMNLDIGNFHAPNVYDQVEMSVPYAVSTHFKTTVANDEGGGRSPYDWDRVMKMLVTGGYRGYLGLEDGGDDPATVVPRELRRLKEIAAKYSA